MLRGVYLSSHKSFGLSLVFGLVLILSGCPYEKYIYNLFSAIQNYVASLGSPVAC